MSWLAMTDNTEHYVEVEDPWMLLPEEYAHAQVEWDRDVGPLLSLPTDTTVYWRFQDIGGHVYLSVSFCLWLISPKGHRRGEFRSLLWTRPGPGWQGGWQSNYSRTLAQECSPTSITESP
jgi:hypothetical protein